MKTTSRKFVVGLFALWLLQGCGMRRGCDCPSFGSIANDGDLSISAACFESQPAFFNEIMNTERRHIGDKSIFFNPTHK